MRMQVLAALCGALSLGGIVETASAQEAPAPAELVYTPVTPCRAFDTSKAGGKLAANTTRNFRVATDGSLLTQGGPKEGCGVPASATAVSMNITATGTAAAGYFQAFPYKTERPVTKALYYGANATSLATPIVGVNKAYISLFTSQASHAIGEVTGYFAPQLFANVNVAGQLVYGTSRVVGSKAIADGVYEITFDRDVRRCSAVSTSVFEGVLTQAGTNSGNIVRVYVWEFTGDPLTMRRAGHQFMVHVIC